MKRLYLCEELAHSLRAGDVHLTEDEARLSGRANFRNETARAATRKTIAHKALLYEK